jgi:peptidoglycan hydrolase CwlO-like protein
VIDELQAEVQKLKGEVAELRAEVDELKVRVARDEDVLCSMSCAWDAHG